MTKYLNKTFDGKNKLLRLSHEILIGQTGGMSKKLSVMANDWTHFLSSYKLN